jgi:4-hydroxy-2-oxoheptanedioate aldolase
MFTNKVKQQLKNNQVVVGMFVKCNAPDLVEIIGEIGYDFCIIDNEHGPEDMISTQHLIRAAESRGLTPIVRLPDYNTGTILHYLDIGAHGIQLPQVNSKEAAAQIVERSKYIPEGSRGVAFPRAASYGLEELTGYMKTANEQTLIVAHCESKESLEVLEDICKIPEIDVIFLGPFDMSQSMGVPGQTTHPLVQDAAKKVVEITSRYGKAAGVYAGSAMAAKDRVEQGFRYIAMGEDAIFFGEKCKQEFLAFKS